MSKQQDFQQLFDIVVEYEQDPNISNQVRLDRARLLCNVRYGSVETDTKITEAKFYASKHQDPIEELPQLPKKN